METEEAVWLTPTPLLFSARGEERRWDILPTTRGDAEKRPSVPNFPLMILMVFHPGHLSDAPMSDAPTLVSV